MKLTEYLEKNEGFDDFVDVLNCSLQDEACEGHAIENFIALITPYINERKARAAEHFQRSESIQNNLITEVWKAAAENIGHCKGWTACVSNAFK